MDQPRFEHGVLSLQWHKGFMGLGRGFDQKMMDQVTQMGNQGFELVAALTQPDPTWFTLFFKRQAR